MALTDIQRQIEPASGRRSRLGSGVLRQFSAFLLAGGVGFLISTALTTIFAQQFGWSPFLAWFPAVAIAIVGTWLMNRLLTFRSRDPHRLAELRRYTLVSLVSAGVNYLGYAACLGVLAHADWSIRHAAAIFIASAFGSALASVVTFCLSRRYAFRPAEN